MFVQDASNWYSVSDVTGITVEHQECQRYGLRGIRRFDEVGVEDFAIGRGDVDGLPVVQLVEWVVCWGGYHCASVWWEGTGIDEFAVESMCQCCEIQCCGLDVLGLPRTSVSSRVGH